MICILAPGRIDDYRLLIDDWKRNSLTIVDGVSKRPSVPSFQSAIDNRQAVIRHTSSFQGARYSRPSNSFALALNLFGGFGAAPIVDSGPPLGPAR
jgi:hypothetical protein